MNRLQSSYLSIEQITDSYLRNGKSVQNVNYVNENTSFAQALERASEQSTGMSGVMFSKHASERLNSRNINLNEAQIERLNKGVTQAKEKSIQESLVMMDNLAFIVNVKNNMVITAMDQNSNDNNVFTNIDGAVIV
ncbi:MAG: TIGR02530 family flagellar biosynthesis protein [Eubacteriales bacterium]|nr:TIGR02530 family flagellar biosynthesis protein [Eubacteriales bacterium]